MGKKSRSESGKRIRNEHLGSRFRELETIFSIKILKFFDANPDQGSRSFLTLDPRSGIDKLWIRDKHPGSATLEKWNVKTYILLISHSNKQNKVFKPALSPKNLLGCLS